MANLFQTGGGSVSGAATTGVSENAGISRLTGTGTPPDITSAATITGDAIVGETLTASISSQTGVGTLSYVWRRDGVPIEYATRSTYVPVEADVGTFVSVIITLTNPAGADSATSAAVEVEEASEQPEWVPDGALIHIDLVRAFNELDAAWVSGTGIVALETLLGADVNADGAWGPTEYDPTGLGSSGYDQSATGNNVAVAFIGALRSKVLDE